MHVKPFGVIEAIVDKMSWLCGPGKHIYVQHDGAAPHTGGGNNELLNLEGQLEDETCIHYIIQPAQSPDMNKNDLSFFNSLSCRAEELKRGVKTLEELMANVEKAYWDYPREILERIHAFQYETYREIIRNDGGNDFFQPHSDIRKRQRDGVQSADLYVPNVLYNQLVDTLANWLDDDE